MDDRDPHIQVCGRLVVRIGGERVEGRLPSRQGKLLFAYLIARRRRSATRPELVDALWEHPPAAADAALSALVSKLRRVLGPELLVGRDELRLSLPPRAFVDLEAAREGIHRAESAVAQADWTAAWAPARAALHTATRGFMPGHEAAWIDEVRRELEDVRLRALECVGAAGLGMGGAEAAAAERSGRALVELAPFRESGYRLLMEALAAQGNVAEALRVHERLRALLRDELGIVPGAQVRAVHERLVRAGGADRTARSGERSTAPGDVS